MKTGPTIRASITDLAAQLCSEVAAITSATQNEASLRASIEGRLGVAAAELKVPWSEATLDRTLIGSAAGTPRFVDSAHGAVVIEYEPPRSFKLGKAKAKVAHAQAQAAEYAALLAVEEGRPATEYVLVAWDGDSSSFGCLDSELQATWEPTRPFDTSAAERLLVAIRDNGVPLVYPRLLAELVGPQSADGQALLPALFDALRAATASGRTSKTLLLYTEWRRLFGQVVGVADEGLRELLERQQEAHGTDYAADPTAYLFALNTHIAIVAKLVAGFALPTAADLADRGVPVRQRIAYLESGELFRGAGILNMFAGQDFFAWYADDSERGIFEPILERMLGRLGAVDFDVRRKSPESLRDLFKGLYMEFTPRELRHALGEFYTPDWLAEHTLDTIGWSPENDLLDPTCGSGTFILEALRRRLVHPEYADARASKLLHGIYGLDLNPLAVLAARASVVVFLANRLDSDNPIRLPIFLADAVNVSLEIDGVFEHRLQTEHGEKKFKVPGHLVRSADFFTVFRRLRDLVNGSLAAAEIYSELSTAFDFNQWPRDDDRAAVRQTVEVLVDLHKAGWDGIWVSILADRFPGCQPDVRHAL